MRRGTRRLMTAQTAAFTAWGVAVGFAPSALADGAHAGDGAEAGRHPEHTSIAPASAWAPSPSAEGARPTATPEAAEGRF